MVKEDIHDLKGVLERNSEKYILQLFEDDQNDVRRFRDYLLANTISAGRVVKYFYSLVVIKRRLNMSFRSANEDDIRRFVIDLDKSDYSEWTKHDLKIIIKKYLKWLGKDNVISWLKVKSVKNGTMPEEVLSEEEIKDIAGVAYTTRDKRVLIF
jgi:integrase/recombinase XerD